MLNGGWWEQVAEYSGLPWLGPQSAGFEAASDWGALKKSGEPPFGLLPLLRLDPCGPSSSSSSAAAGQAVGHATAICAVVAQLAGPCYGGERRLEGRGLEGAPGSEFAMSMMLMAEGEDLYALMKAHLPTVFGPAPNQASDESQEEFWAALLPSHLLKLEALLLSRSSSSSDESIFGFAGRQRSVAKVEPLAGELYLFAMLHQAFLIRRPKVMAPDAAGNTPQCPLLRAWYTALLVDPRTQRVLEGGSPFGAIGPYFSPLSASS
mmetsp:Transcript_66613/g.150428  ORF Transcript_66613/g.150428 Transcript_66613/m.150428 type:complete len:264 (-) Transcript_66613:187-978(-)